MKSGIGITELALSPAWSKEICATSNKQHLIKYFKKKIKINKKNLHYVKSRVAKEYISIFTRNIYVEFRIAYIFVKYEIQFWNLWIFLPFSWYSLQVTWF